MTLIIIGSILSLLGLAVILLGSTAIREGVAETQRPQPWTLVCDSAGHHSYLGFDGELVDQDFPTRAEAEAAAAKSRQWHTDYAAGKFTDAIAKRKAAELARAQAMKPCAP